MNTTEYNYHNLTTLGEAAAKRARIKAWMRTAISKAEAERRGLRQLSLLTAIRNWTCREALYDFSLQAVQAKPVLVMMDYRRAALYGTPAMKAQDGDDSRPLPCGGL